MKCHYSYYIDKGVKRRFIIPHCMNVVNSNDIKDCICQDNLTSNQFEKIRFKETVDKLTEDIDYLKRENNSLLEIIKHLKRRNYE